MTDAEFANIVYNSQTGEKVVIPFTPEEVADTLSRRAAFAQEQAAREAAQEAAKAEQVALEEKATTKPVNEEKLLASLPDDALREIILNLWARVAYLEKLQGIDHSAKG